MMPVACTRRAVAFTTLLASALFCSLAWAQTQTSKPALSHAVDDAGLTWGPCPPFLPKGCGLAVLHGDPARPNVDVFLRIPGRTALPRHWHTSAERMILSAGELSVTYDGQKPMTLRTGSYAFGPAKLPHEGYCVSTTPCVLFIAFESPLDAVPVERRN